MSLKVSLLALGLGMFLVSSLLELGLVLYSGSGLPGLNLGTRWRVSFFCEGFILAIFEIGVTHGRFRSFFFGGIFEIVEYFGSVSLISVFPSETMISLSSCVALIASVIFVDDDVTEIESTSVAFCSLSVCDRYRLDSMLVVSSVADSGVDGGVMSRSPSSRRSW